MSGRENNKLAAGILIAGLIAMITGKIVDVLYEPNLHPAQRGYSVAVTESTGSAPAAALEEKVVIDIKALMAKASAENGKALMAKCSACHTVDKGGANRVGPNLWETIGRARGTHEGYTYSQSLKALGGNWDYESLALLLHKPKQYLPGTKMSFAGFNKVEDAADVIAYLRTLSDSPKPLP